MLGLDFPDQFKSYFEDSVYQKLRNDLYNKDRLNDSLNFNVAESL